MGSLEEPPGAASLNPAEPEPAGSGAPGPPLGLGQHFASPGLREEGRLALEEAWRDAQILPLPGKCTVGNSFSGALGVY